MELNGIFRARKNDGAAFFTNARELWHPPREVITRRGRFNDIGQPIFYGCSTANGAMIEVHPHAGDTITLLVARAAGDFASLTAAHIGLDRCSAPQLLEVRQNRLPTADKNLQYFMNEYRVYNKWRSIEDFLSDLATKLFSEEIEEKSYVMTIQVADVLLSAPSTQALSYPSIASDGKSINLAIPPQIVDQSFRPAEAWVIHVDEKADRLPDGSVPGGPVFRFRFTHCCDPIPDDGALVWERLAEETTLARVAHIVAPPRFRPYNPISGSG
jgi:hypothetical protein